MKELQVRRQNFCLELEQKMEEAEQKITEVAEPTPEEKAAELEAKEAKVLELRRAGFTFQRIAEEVGYATPSGAQRALERIMTRNVPQAPEEFRWQELDRLDRMQVALWPRAMKGDDRAIGTIVRLMERRARLVGIDAPQRIQAEVVNYDGTRDIDGDIERIVNILRGVDSSEPLEVESGTGENGTTAAAGGLEDLALHGGARSGQDENGSGVVSLGSDSKPDDALGDSSPDIR
jgi:AraC-like DNA-binding protein